ncbi:hypothetical protein LR48_Vigan08g100600 [Vigna angularis]|uniref:Uncharacterized protein n=1 Tax=Phaseolus angularis TaxID=3914 RepID=A0A0L9V666_PHAAN|nr:hypothetical protein LR48_Vigan08g100600 [Vigna angularis]
MCPSSPPLSLILSSGSVDGIFSPIQRFVGCVCACGLANSVKVFLWSNYFKNSAEFYRIMQKAECAQLSARSYTSSYASVSVWAYTSSYDLCFQSNVEENSKEECLVDGIGILKYECGYRAKLAFMLIFCDYSFSSREE